MLLWSVGLVMGQGWEGYWLNSLNLKRHRCGQGIYLLVPSTKYLLLLLKYIILVESTISFLFFSAAEKKKKGHHQQRYRREECPLGGLGHCMGWGPSWAGACGGKVAEVRQ